MHTGTSVFGLQLLVILLFNTCSFSQPWKEHGHLVVSENGHFLEHADGTGFFWLGGTAWMLPRLDPDQVDRYLKDRAEKGFNVIQFTANNMGRVNYLGELPFRGKGRPWNQVLPNESYWEHIDYIIDRAAELGLYIAFFAWWGNDAGDPGWREGKETRQHFADPDVHNYLYGKYLGDRYNDRPNMIWVGAGECHKPAGVMFPDRQRPLGKRHRNRLTAVIRGIRETEPGIHLYTIHPVSFLSSSEDFHHEQWLDFNMIQSHAVPEYIVPLVWADWNLEPAKPSLVAEGWYEAENRLYSRWTGMKTVHDDTIHEAWKQRYQAYWAVFAGGFGFTYGHRNIWRMEDDSGNPGRLPQHVLDAPGAASLVHLKSLIESKPVHSRVPDPDLVSPGTRGRTSGLSPDLRIATRALDGSWAFIYTTRGSLIRVRMNRLATGQADAFWYSPDCGKWTAEGSQHDEKIPFRSMIPSGQAAGDCYFDPPGNPCNGNDRVLVLEIH